MKTRLVVTVAAPDRPGIVDELSSIIAASNANWEESRLANLAGMFAGVLLVGVEADRASELADNLRKVSDKDISVMVREAPPETKGANAVALRLHLTGADHEGIIHGFSSFLAKQGVNVERVRTEIVNAPYSGGPLFKARFLISCPPSLAVVDLHDRLRELAEDLAVDIELGPA